MAYGSALVDNIQSSTANTPVVFKDGNGTQIGTLCRAWVNFNGGTATIRGSFNVTSITKAGTGLYQINFTTSMPDANYAVAIAIEENGTTCMTSQDNSFQQTTASAFVRCVLGTSNTNYDPEQFNVIVFR